MQNYNCLTSSNNRQVNWHDVLWDLISLSSTHENLEMPRMTLLTNELIRPRKFRQKTTMLSSFCRRIERFENERLSVLLTGRCACCYRATCRGTFCRASRCCRRRSGYSCRCRCCTCDRNSQCCVKYDMCWLFWHFDIEQRTRRVVLFDLHREETVKRQCRADCWSSVRTVSTSACLSLSLSLSLSSRNSMWSRMVEMLRGQVDFGCTSWFASARAKAFWEEKREKQFVLLVS